MLQIYHFFFIFMLSTEKIIHFFKLQIKTQPTGSCLSCGTIICRTDNRIVCFTQLFNDLWDLFYNFAPK